MTEIDLSAIGDLMKPLTMGIPRVLAMLLVFPLLPGNTFPLTVRNGVAVALTVPLYPLMRASAEAAPTEMFGWLAFLVRELAIGALIGWLYACVIWAFQLAGDLLDTQSGTSVAAVFDPMSRESAATFAQFLRTFALLVFLLVGGLHAMLGTLYESYRLWPVTGGFPLSPRELSDRVIASSVGYLSLGLALALPLVMLLFVVEFGLGLISRSLPQMNVFSLSMPIKMVVAMLGVALILGHHVDRLAQFVRGVRPPW